MSPNELSWGLRVSHQRERGSSKRCLVRHWWCGFASGERESREWIAIYPSIYN